MLNLTRLVLGIAHESQFQGLGIIHFSVALNSFQLAHIVDVINGDIDITKFFTPYEASENMYLANASESVCPFSYNL